MSEIRKSNKDYEKIEKAYVKLFNDITQSPLDSSVVKLQLRCVQHSFTIVYCCWLESHIKKILKNKINKHSLPKHESTKYLKKVKDLRGINPDKITNVVLDIIGAKEFKRKISIYNEIQESLKTIKKLSDLRNRIAHESDNILDDKTETLLSPTVINQQYKPLISIFIKGINKLMP